MCVPACIVSTYSMWSFTVLTHKCCNLQHYVTHDTSGISTRLVAHSASICRQHHSDPVYPDPADPEHQHPIPSRSSILRSRTPGSSTPGSSTFRPSMIHIPQLSCQGYSTVCVVSAINLERDTSPTVLFCWRHKHQWTVGDSLAWGHGYVG